MKTDFSEVLNVKGVTPADKKFYEKYIAPKVRPFEKHVRNPLTGWSKEVNPVVAACVRLVQNLAYNNFSKQALLYWGISDGQRVQVFDRARYLILKLDREVYSEVID